MLMYDKNKVRLCSFCPQPATGFSTRWGRLYATCGRCADIINKENEADQKMRGK